MNAIQALLTDSLCIWTAADTGKKSGRGRASSNAGSVYGIRKLRELILELAVRGKLVPQDANDEPASELLKRIQAEKARLIAEGKIKKDKPLAPISEKEKLFTVPQGWEWQRLSKLCILENGDRGKNYPNKSALVEAGIPFVNAGHLQNGQIDKNQMTFITKERFDILRGGKFQENDILFCLRGSLGKSALVKGFEEGAIASSLVIIRLFPHLDATYFVNYFDCPLSSKMVKKYDNGTAQPNLSSTDLAKFLVPLPPLAEQHRIVAKVDELMALCDQLETRHGNAFDAHEKLVSHLLGTLTQSQNADDFSANWQRIAAHFDTLFSTEASIDALKQTLLQLAVMGKLVPQNAKDEPASALLKRIQAEKAKLIAEGKIKKEERLAAIVEDEVPYELPLSWMWIRVSEIAELTTSGSRDWAKYLSNEGAKFITMGNLARGSYELRLDNIRYVNPPESGEGSRTKLAANDLLISITGDVGNLGRIPEGFGDAYINQHTCLLRFLPQCRNRYFPEVMRSPMAALQFNAPQRGIKNSFRLGDLDEMIIPLPPLAEQHRIVAKVDELMTLCEQLKTRITNANQLQQKLADVLVVQAVA